MSIQHCFVCDRDIDTDYNAEHFIYVHPTHCKYSDYEVEATKQCDMCGEGLCDFCGYTIPSDEGETHLCSECYDEVMSRMDEDTA